MLLKDHLIAHYKMNENTVGDNAELVANGDFTVWVDDNPYGWRVSGESGTDPEISEVGTGEGHGGTGTGCCNFYTSGTIISLNIQKLYGNFLSLVVGRRYRLAVKIDTLTTGSLQIFDFPQDMLPLTELDTVKTYSFTFVATKTNPEFYIQNFSPETCDVTIDNFSIKLCAVEDSSDNDHDGLAQQDTDQIHRAGKINGAFDFAGGSAPTDYIEIADHVDFSPILTPFSISAWIYMHVVVSFFIVGKGVYNTDAEWLFEIRDTGYLRFRLFDESVASCYIGRQYNATLMAGYQNQWIHLIATYDGGVISAGIRMYLNSVRVDDLDSKNALFVAVENLAAPVYIGRYNTSYANGLIDNVMFFDKELTPLEVKYLYNGSAGVENIPTLIELSRTGCGFSSRQEM